MSKYVEFEEGQKYTRKKKDDQIICDTPDDFSDAGYILEPDDFIVDIDDLDKDTIREMIKFFKIKTQIVWTDRGAHLYFKKRPGFKRARGVCALGFPLEYKHYDNCYAITIKHNGKLRQVENESKREQLPKFLETIATKRELVGLSEGDGRNEALHNHKRLITKLGRTRDILYFINKYIFDTPLDDKEFITVARDESMDVEKDGETIIADLIMKERRVVMYNNTLFYYDGMQYINDPNKIDRMVYEYCEGMKSRFVEEVVKQMKMRAPLVEDAEFKIKLRNGYLFEGQFYPYSYTEFTPYFIDLNYQPDMEPVEEVETYLTNLTGNDPDYREYVLEIIATSLIVNREFKRALSKFFIFVGRGGNGKGTLLQIISKILTDKNVCTASIQELSDEKYLANLVGKLANLGDDIQNDPINKNQMKVLKNISSGDNIQIRRLYENPFNAKLNPTLIFTSNHKVKTFDKDYSYKRRVRWCPMYYTPEKIETDYITRLTTTEALEYWLKLIVNAYKNIYKRKDLIPCDVVDNFTTEYHRENDSTIEFLEMLDDTEIEYKRPPQIMDEYVDWCESNGETIQRKGRLKEAILDRGFIVKQVQRKHVNGGRGAKVYVKEERK